MYLWCHSKEVLPLLFKKSYMIKIVFNGGRFGSIYIQSKQEPTKKGKRWNRISMPDRTWVMEKWAGILIVGRENVLRKEDWWELLAVLFQKLKKKKKMNKVKSLRNLGHGSYFSRWESQLWPWVCCNDLLFCVISAAVCVQITTRVIGELLYP